jgi:hypothetical protein
MFLFRLNNTEHRRECKHHQSPRRTILQKSFANFSNFYQAIKGEPYPLDYEQQGILYHLTEQNLLILGLNSAWQLDHHYKTRANIHPIALSNALDQISLNRKTYENC